MKPHKRTIGVIAKGSGTDPDELLITLWSFSLGRFDYLKSQGSILKVKDVPFVRNLLARRVKSRQPFRIPQRPLKTVEIVYLTHDFASLGRELDPTSYLSTDTVKGIYSELVRDFSSSNDPINPAGVKDESMLEAAVFHHRTSFEGRVKYPTVETAAAALMYALSLNHPFHNGNKRTALVSMLVFLDSNRLQLTCDEDELFKLSIKLADHKLVEEKHLYMDAEIHALARWIHSCSKPIRKGERPITLRKLKQVLAEFNAEMLPNGRGRRVIPAKGFFGTDRPLTTRRALDNAVFDGREVSKSFVKALRKDLELDEEHGFDREVFYGEATHTTSDFINKYKSLLKRLSKV